MRQQSDSPQPQPQTLSRTLRWDVAIADSRGDAPVGSDSKDGLICRIRSLPDVLVLSAIVLVVLANIALLQQSGRREKDSAGAGQHNSSSAPKQSYCRAALSTNEEAMLVTCSDGKIYELNTLTGIVLKDFEPPTAVAGDSILPRNVVYLPNQASFLATYASGAIVLWDSTAAGDRRPQLLGRHQQEVFACDVSHDGRWAVTCCRNGVAKLWDIPKRTLIREWAKLPTAIEIARFSPHDEVIAMGDSSGYVHLIDPGNVQPIRRWRAHDFFAKSLSFGQDDETMATCGFDGTAVLWNWRTGEEIQRFSIDAPEAFSACLADHDRLLAVSDNEGGIQVFDIVRRMEVDYIGSHTRAIGELMATQRSMLVSVSFDGTIERHDLTRSR